MLDVLNAPPKMRGRFGSSLLDRRILVPLAIFAISQVIAFAAFVSASGGAYGDFIDRWDGVWYRWITREGYVPDPGGRGDLPWDEGVWAFFPLYPMLVRVVLWVMPLGWDVAAPLLSVTAGGAAVVVLHRLFVRYVGARKAAVATALLCAWMAAPVMQMAYTESLGLLLLAGAFTFLADRRYIALLGTLVLLALCRPVIVPFTVVLAAHVVMLWRQRARRSDLWQAVAVLAACPLLFLLWPAFAWIMSGNRTAYFDAMATWGNEGAPRSFVFDALGAGVVGWAAIAACIAWAVWMAIRMVPGPVELRTWVAVYPLYILAGTYMSGSIVRYLLLNFPAVLLWTPLVDRGKVSRVVLAALLVSSVVLSVAWVHVFVGAEVRPNP